MNLHTKINEKLNYFYETKKIPHLLFHGSSGSGKRTIVYRFLNKIYQNDHKKMKSNVMHVNCAHGKGIKFIREELKFFAKSNVQSNTGVLFKTIVLMNADNLTIDAQSALRRCIELFSSTTRFFIIVENKNKLLNPILSRFCEIYVPEHMDGGRIKNLHQISINNELKPLALASRNELINKKMTDFISFENNHRAAVEIAEELYENAVSCIDIINWLEHTDLISVNKKANLLMYFDESKFEYRSEKLLMLCLFDFLMK
jgi:DNA polymerase III delta prime subunit